MTPQTTGTPASGGQAQWTQNRERGSAILLRLMSWLSLQLGRRITRLVLLGISLYFILFAHAQRRTSRTYLHRALGRYAEWSDGFRHVHTFASTIHDRVYFLNDRFDLFDIKIEGEALFHEAMAPGRGAFLMGAHLGSFEAVRALGRQQPNLSIAMLMYEENARKINATLAAINPAATGDIIPLGQIDSMLQVQARLDEGAAIGILGDRTLGDEPVLHLPFLGQEAPFPLGPMRLAAMLKRPVLFMAGLYLGDNRYVIRFERLADFSQVERAGRDAAIRAAVAAYAVCLERHCRAAPYNWFNFFDFWQERA